MRRASDWSWWGEARAIAARHARGASDAADDLAQDLAVAALERGDRVEREGAWLERVGRNAEIDRWRGERRRRALAGEIVPPVGPPDPEERLLAGERRGALRRALAALPRPLRRATLARFHADLPFEAVAARLETEPVTARTRVHRALARLRVSVGGLRALFVVGPGAQATVLGVALIAGVARPVAPPARASVAAPAAHAPEGAHVRRVAVEPPPARAAGVPMRASAPRPRASAVTAAAPATAGAFPPAVQRLSFGEDLVEGDLAGPDGVVVMSDPVVAHLSLIELRWHFLPEIVKTLEDL